MKPKIPSIHMYVRLALAGLAALVAELILSPGDYFSAC